MVILVIDIGGTHVKLALDGDADTARRFASGKQLTPAALVACARDAARDWQYDAVSIGYPGATDPNGPRREPGNLSPGWVDFDFRGAFDRPVRIVNDAAMQALGAYEGGRMLFLGLGTGLGSALVADRVIVTLELGCLNYGPHETIADRLGKEGLKKYGKAAWQEVIHEIADTMREAFAADSLVLGGGNVKRVDPLPPGVRRGGNHDAFAGGVRLWQNWIEHHDAPPSDIWRVVW